MADYSLERLSTRTFEQLVQTLAQKHLGARTLIFGDGPDGGREAAFTGVCKLPPLNTKWTGCVVIQAKFLQVPHAKPIDNVSWLLKQLTEEMDKWSTRPRNANSHVNYYVLATNVATSGVAKRGGKDRVTAVLESYKKALKWKDWALWDRNEISRMLDNAADIRTAYAAWITSGDVLMEMLQNIRASRPDFEQAMLARLQEDFCNAQFAKLRQAGHGSEDKTPLSRLFVDLPITDSQLMEPPEETQASGNDKAPRKLATFLNTLLTKGDERLTPTSLSTTPRFHFQNLTAGDVSVRVNERRLEEPDVIVTRHHSAPVGDDDVSYDFGEWRPSANRIVLMGGPGQGKTTLGQFASQLYRAALLSSSKRPLMQETLDALDTLQRQCGKEITRPSARRYPVWIDLKQLAKWLGPLSEDPPPTLLMFIAKRIGTEVEVTDLKEWLGLYPWFIVFDGLDEVPPSSGRERMLRCIQSFVTEAHTLNSDVLVLCTTRPQGYSREFDQRYYRHQWLAPLSPQRALVYGEKVLDARHGKTGDDRKTYGLRLSQAAENPMTGRVMRSPLQVTIMAALVERVGKPPEQRWKLFTEYYSVIYERERERGTSWSDALAKYDAEVNAIHRRIGWRLQVRSEVAQNSDARLTTTEFRNEVRMQLSKEGHFGEQLDTLVSLLGEAATERLVFLVAVGSEEVGFEIRSLQEFMASDHLFEEGDHVAAHHLRTIAPITYWRNVFLFASGRVFAERRNLRDHLLGTLDHLNEDSEHPAAKLTLAGSILAIDLLEDGSANHIPASRDALLRKACRILDIALPTEHRRLAEAALGSGGIPVLQEELARRLAAGDSESRSGAKECLIKIIKLFPWAMDLWMSHFELNAALAAYLLTTKSDWKPSIDFTTTLTSALRGDSPYSQSVLWPWASDQLRVNIPPALLQAVGTFGTQPINILSDDRLRLPFGFLFRPVFQGDSCVALGPTPQFDGFHPDWNLLWINYQFSSSPTSDSLASALQSLSSLVSSPLNATTLSRLSWPIVAALAYCTSEQDVSTAISLAKSGEFGNTQKWKRFENNLIRRELTVSEVIEMLSDTGDSGNSRIGAASRDAGFSASAMWLVFESAGVFTSHVDERLAAEIAGGTTRLLKVMADKRPELAARCLRAFARMDPGPDFDIATFIKVAKTVSERRLPVSVDWLERKLLGLANEAMVPFYDELAGFISEASVVGGRALRPDSTTNAAAELARAILKNPTASGLWRLFSLLPIIPKSPLYKEVLAHAPQVLSRETAADIIVLRIQALSWTAHSASDFATEIFQAMSFRPDLPKIIAGALEQIAVSEFYIECLPAALLGRLPQDDWKNRCVIRALLRSLHLRRASTLTETSDQLGDADIGGGSQS